MTPTPLKFIRLKTGEDLIAEITLLDKGFENRVYKLVNPMRIIYMPNNRGGVHIALINWIFTTVCSATEFYLNPLDILVISILNPELEEYYVKALQMEVVAEEEKSTEDNYNHELDGEEYKDEDVAYIKQVMQDIKEGKRKLN